jgi:hypothetical protein
VLQQKLYPTHDDRSQSPKDEAVWQVERRDGFYFGEGAGFCRRRDAANEISMTVSRASLMFKETLKWSVA